MKRMLSGLVLLCAALVPAFGQERLRVFISDSRSWEIGGSMGTSHHGGGGALSGGARPQTVEIMKTFNERCPQAIVTSERSRADYVVLFDHEGGKGLLRDNKIAVFDREGDMVYSGSTRVLGNAVKDACRVITDSHR